jgi:hypothetical protein
MQFKLMNDMFNDAKQRGSIKYYDLDKKKAPVDIMNEKGEYSMPTWYIPTSNGYGTIKKGVIRNESTLKKLIQPKEMLKTSNMYFGGGGTRRRTRFGDYTPTVASLSKGNINYYSPNAKNWATINGSTPGTFERSGQDYYSKGFFYGPRMGGNPSNDYSTALFLNRTCNNINTRDSKKNPGLLYDSTSQMVAFGKKRRRSHFGSTLQPGPAYNNRKNILYGGGTNQKEMKPSLGYGYISTAKPLTAFGKRRKSLFGGNCKQLKFNNDSIKEGSTISISPNGKIKVKN